MNRIDGLLGWVARILKWKENRKYSPVLYLHGNELSCFFESTEKSFLIQFE